ncbi:hypothetical protein NQ317_013436, partial [Molorchus minor]
MFSLTTHDQLIPRAAVISQSTASFPISKDLFYHISKVTTNPIWSENWNKNDTNIYFNPVLLSCRIPSNISSIGTFLTTKPCGKSVSTNNYFKVKERGGKNERFTICVKPLDFLEDISKRLIQWIEINRLLGADRIEIYVRKVTNSVWKALKWYSLKYPGKFLIRKFRRITQEKDSSPDVLRNIWQKRRYELIAYNDCFYRNLETTDFIIPLDIDEIIVPRTATNWKQLLQGIFSHSPEPEEKYASFMTSNTYYFGELTPNDIFFLKNINRSQFSPPEESGKSFISTKNALTVFNHYALQVLKPGITRVYFLPSKDVQLNHYKQNCDVAILPE